MTSRVPAGARSTLEEAFMPIAALLELLTGTTIDVPRGIGLAQPKERVIMAHGWLGLPLELRKLGRALKAAGFDVAYVRHHTLFGRYEAGIDAALREIEADKDRPVHLIGLSYGGLIMRGAAVASSADIRSLLLIGTPNAGSPLADILCHVFPTPAVRRLCCAAPPLPEPPPGIRVGCIAGDRGGLMRLLFKMPNDILVSTLSAFKVRHDYGAIIHCNHYALHHHPETFGHALAFLLGRPCREESGWRLEGWRHAASLTQ
jgi:pimeloyl-ACP methyl ester carboxylesterase